MSLRFRVLVGACFLLALIGITAGVIWWGETHKDAFHYVLGIGFIGLGAVLTLLYLTLPDDFLRRHLGEAGADQMRRMGRGGWIGVLIGSAMLGIFYLDRWIQATTTQTQFTVALNRGRAAVRARDWPTAVAAFSEAIQLDPNSASAFRQRGVAFLHQGELDRAVEDFDASIRLAPVHAGVFYNRGLVYFRRKEYGRALTDFDEAIRLNPRFARAYLARSLVHGKKGDEAKARVDRQRAIEIDPALDKTEEGNLVRWAPLQPLNGGSRALDRPTAELFFKDEGEKLWACMLSSAL